MKNNIIRFLRLIIGLFLFALGIVMTINAGLGVAPWDVFHQGLSKVTGITLGRASITVGAMVVVLNIVLGQPIGWGTVLNMLLIGIFMDLLMLNHLIPIFDGLVPRYLMLILGKFVEGTGCWLYISAAFGAGPRDGLMVVLTRRTGKSVRFIKSIIEVGAVIIGYILGGSAGIGTLIMASLGGPIFQLVFKTVKFNVKDVEHRFIQDDIKYIKEKFGSKSENEEIL